MHTKIYLLVIVRLLPFPLINSLVLSCMVKYFFNVRKVLILILD